MKLVLEESRGLLLLLEKRVTRIKDSGGEGVEKAWTRVGNETDCQGVDPAPRDVGVLIHFSTHSPSREMHYY